MGNNLQRNGNGEAIDEDFSLIRSGCIQLRLRQGGECPKIYACVPASLPFFPLLKYSPTQPNNLNVSRQ